MSFGWLFSVRLSVDLVFKPGCPCTCRPYGGPWWCFRFSRRCQDFGATKI